LAGEQYETYAPELIYDRALRNLKNIDYVGTTDNFEEFSLILKYYLDLPTSYNKSKLNYGQNKQPIESSILKYIENVNQYDSKLYEQSCSMYAGLRMDFLDDITDESSREPIKTLSSSGESYEVVMDDAISGHGFHEREKGVHSDARWLGPDKISQIRVRCRVPGDFEFEIWVTSIIRDSVIETMRIMVGDAIVPYRLEAGDGVTLIRGWAMGKRKAANSLRFRFYFEEAASAFEVAGMPDNRKKTIAIERLRIVAL
jgi:hypothetical protein